jgi:hypothetical protein
MGLSRRTFSWESVPQEQGMAGIMWLESGYHWKKALEKRL